MASWVDRLAAGTLDGAEVFARAEALSFPRVIIRPGEEVCAGAEAWCSFCCTAFAEDLAEAMYGLDGLEALRWLSPAGGVA